MVRRTTAEGPGLRAALWLQGCTIRCRGCFNSHLWPLDGGRSKSVSSLTNELLSIGDIEGVTLLGGEPFDQALPLASLARGLRAAGLGVMTFTGNTLDSLRERAGPGDEALLAATDLLVDGPFKADEPDPTRPWLGSKNQRFIHLTDRYRGSTDKGQDDRVEVRLSTDGSVLINGQADARRLADLRRMIRDPHGNV